MGCQGSFTSRDLHGLVCLSVVTAWCVGRREEEELLELLSLAGIYVQSPMVCKRDVDPALREPTVPWEEMSINLAIAQMYNYKL